MPVAGAHPEDTELHGATWRALRRRKGRAGALPRWHFDRAAKGGTLALLSVLGDLVAAERERLEALVWRGGQGEGALVVDVVVLQNQPGEPGKRAAVHGVCERLDGLTR